MSGATTSTCRTPGRGTSAWTGIRCAGLHREHGFEACDLLGPGNELIHVKRAWGSSPLSHLFSQALVSAQALATSPDARAIFTAKVRAHPRGRDLLADFQPKKVIFAILLKNGEKLTADTLFSFSQVTLASTARELESRCPVPPDLSHGQAADLGWLSFSGNVLRGCGRPSASECEPFRRGRLGPMPVRTA
ncbi:MAG: TIGR04141 family sporadically distributed protein [Streptosporangiaceae bacterium]